MGHDTLFLLGGGFMEVSSLHFLSNRIYEEHPLHQMHQRRLLGIDAPVLERLSVVLSDSLREECKK